jgi:rubrerythrin
MLNTASAVISFIIKLEEETAKFYEKSAQEVPEIEEIFLSFSKENRHNKVMVERAYYSVITDALEACFSFKEGLDPTAYTVKTELAEGTSYMDYLRSALETEKAVQKLYVDATALSEGLMADIPRVFKMIARKRDNRIAKLKALLEKCSETRR